MNRDNLLFAFLKLKSKMYCFLPRFLTLLIGRLTGRFLYYFFPLRKKVALINIKIAFPKKSNRDIKKILKECYLHFGMLMSDFLRLPILNQKNINNLIKLDNQTKILLKENNPCIIMTGHIGNWELFLPIFGYNNYAATGVAKTQRSKAGDRFFNWIRGCKNTMIIASKNNPVKELNKAFEKGYNLIFISDQNAGSKGTKNYLFNAPTYTPKGAAFFNVKNDSPILYITITMDSDYTYTITSKKLDFLFKDDSKNQKISDINEAYNKELESSIIKYPEQYFWFHKKWDKKYYQ